MRIAAFDLLRFILTLIVVNFHIRIIAGIYPGNFLEAFIGYTVPIFIIMSFYFRSKKPLSERIRRLFIPFIFWSVVAFAVTPNFISIKNLAIQFLTGQLVNTPLYYLVLLILFTLINAFIERFLNKFKAFIYVLIILTALALEYMGINYSLFAQTPAVFAKTYGRFFELIKFVPVGLFFGYLSQKNIRKINYLILSFVIFLLFLQLPQPKGFHYCGLNIFIGSTAVFSFVIWFSQFEFSKLINKAANFLGRYSFGVYLCHYIFIQFFMKILPSLRLLAVNYLILLLFISVGICYFFCFLLDGIGRSKLSFLVK